MSEVVVIYDGLCQLCKDSVNWVSKKLEITAIAFQQADLNKYQLTLSECEKSVQVVYEGKRYQAAAAIILLLRLRKNIVLSTLLEFSGKVGDIIYYWVARNRSNKAVKFIAKTLFR
jgi:predicted DCC family thiol-disulfide oxidoreductase YuxK